MQLSWLTVWLCLAGLALVQSLLLALQVWEHRRFARNRIVKPLDCVASRRVAVFAPCKGLDVGLEDNLRPLLEQDYQNYEVTFIVQSADDPACGTIGRLIDEHPNVEARLLVSGAAVDTGQKVHNLRAATAALPRHVEILAFIDSDARPGRNWLPTLLQRINRQGTGAVTGYRWFVPARSTLANYVLYSINCTVAALFGPGGHHLIWGGSWAIRREAFDALRLRDVWRSTLSDDLVATGVLQRAGLDVQFEPACMLASPLDFAWGQMLGFLRRQYVMGRFYLPRWWMLAFISATIATAGFWGGLAVLVLGLAQRADWTWIPAFGCTLLYLASMLRGYERWRLARVYLPQQRRRLAAAAAFDILAGPLAGLVNWLGLAGSLVGHHVNWRGITYRLQRGGQVQLVPRLANKPSGSV